MYHNTYRHIQENEQEVKALCKDNELEGLKGGSYLKYFVEDDGKEKNISAEHGSSLAALLMEGKYTWNAKFGGKAVVIDNGQYVDLGEGINLILLFPN